MDPLPGRTRPDDGEGYEAQLLLNAGAIASDPEPVRRQTALHAACSTEAPLGLVDELLSALARDAARLHGDEAFW